MEDAWERKICGYAQEEPLREDEAAEMALSSHRAAEWRVVNREVEALKRRYGDEFNQAEYTRMSRMAGDDLKHYETV